MAIGELKSSLATTTGVAVESQRVIYRGRVLADDATLATAGVGDGHTVHMVERAPEPPPPAPGTCLSAPHPHTPCPCPTRPCVSLVVSKSRAARETWGRKGLLTIHLVYGAAQALDVTLFASATRRSRIASSAAVSIERWTRVDER
jgi:hypothetical protein